MCLRTDLCCTLLLLFVLYPGRGIVHLRVKPTYFPDFSFFCFPPRGLELKRAEPTQKKSCATSTSCDTPIYRSTSLPAVQLRYTNRVTPQQTAEPTPTPPYCTLYSLRYSYFFRPFSTSSPRMGYYSVFLVFM